MPRVLAVSGSLRKDSYNSALLRVLPSLAPAGMEFDFFEGLAELPLYCEDLDTEHPPAAVRRLRTAIAEHDAIVIATPEYLHALPGVVKNALDWASRPVSAPALSGKVVLVLVATPGRAFGFRSLADAAQIINALRNVVVPAPEVVVNSAQQVLVADGDGGWRLEDPAARAFIGVQLGIMADLVEAGVAEAVESSFQRRSAELAQFFASRTATS
ncbi:NAD(P)H-dependent oxidoreductase [Streptomyces sp. NPDC007851]|uniref:NAD(P)H-dependent oxidoreductase n=1 Tax=Streptomyces sp. NPDC007851 TaxID=3155008 RepID=UPI00340D4ACB